MKNIFISYSRTDTNYAMSLADDMERLGRFVPGGGPVGGRCGRRTSQRQHDREHRLHIAPLALGRLSGKTLFPFHSQ